MKQLLFIRHGATAGNLEKRYIGRTDEALCKEGMAQIQELKEKNLRADAIYVSPMRRTRQTARLLFPGMRFRIVEDFRETDFGIFEGKTYGELSGSAEYQSWLDSNCLDPIPEGESVSRFKARCCSAFREIAASLPEDTVTAFVVHGGTIMAILEAFGPKQDFYSYHIPNGAYLSCTLTEEETAWAVHPVSKE